MTTLKLKGEERPILPLTYGQIKRNRALIDRLTETGLDAIQRTEAAADFLALAFPDCTPEDFEELPAGTIQVAALSLYTVTFARPEDVAPASPNPSA